MNHLSWTRGEYRLTTDPAAMDVAAITQYVVKESYWGAQTTPETLRRGLEGSFNFHLLHNGKQVGLARVITDFATLGYLSDVYVLPEHAGRGLGQWMLQTILEHPELQGFRRWLLLTRDAHGLYKKFGFASPRKPETFMELPGERLAKDREC
jgi:GNAT superfamily N-acetyltransferase